MVTRTHLNIILYVHTSPALTCITLPCLDLLLRSLRPDHLVPYSDFEHPRLSPTPPSTCVFSLPFQFTSHDHHHTFRKHVTQKTASVLRPTYYLQTMNMWGKLEVKFQVSFSHSTRTTWLFEALETLTPCRDWVGTEIILDVVTRTVRFPVNNVPDPSPGLAKRFEGGCSHFLQISKKSFCVPMGILKSKIRS